MKNGRAEAAAPALPVERRSAGAVASYIALTKPRLNLLVVATSAAGFHLGSDAAPAIGPMLQAVVGTALVAGGAAALNQVVERDTDALMRRTRLRPLPDRRLSSSDAIAFGVLLAAVGVGLLALESVLAAALALATLVIYVVVYTPLKRRSTMATLIGAVPGALPPAIGWAAAENGLSAGGWALFAIVFLWQIPHFMAIAWMYRDDYARAGFPMLPVLEPEGRRTGRQATIYAALLLPVSLIPSAIGIAGLVYLATAIVLGLGLLALAIRFAGRRNDANARALFYGSITYLPLVLLALIAGHQP